jgi:hypothetical protein
MTSGKGWDSGAVMVNVGSAAIRSSAGGGTVVSTPDTEIRMR